MWRLATAFFRRDFLLTISYRGAFALQMLSIVFGVPVLYFISQVFGGGETQSLAPYGGRYFPFLLLGVAFQDYITVSQSAFTTSIREHQFMGTLEIIMLSPTPVPIILIFSSLWGYFFTSIRFLLYLLIGVAFGLDMNHANLLSFLVVVVFSVACMASIGILLAALTLYLKRGEGINMLVTGVTLAIGGVAYPVSLLPHWLQWVSNLLPFTHSLAGMRLALLKGAGVADLFPQLAVLLAFTAVLFPLGLYSFALATRHAKVAGTLGQY